MNRRAFLCLLVLLGAGSPLPVYAGLRDNNLIEFSRGSYGETFGRFPARAFLWPPFVKIYQDGRVIHYEGDDDGRYFVSRLTLAQLDSLKKRLASEKYLWKSRFIDMEGDEFYVHGGVSYIRYLDGDKEILIATEVKPRRGPWVQLTDAIWDYVPADHSQVYYPAVIGVYTRLETSTYRDPNPPVWPFGNQIKLSAKVTTISNQEVIEYLFDDPKKIFLWHEWVFKQDDARYSITLANSPGWFEPDYVNKALAKVWNNGYRVKER